MQTALAVACSDIHLSLNPPPARAGEDWFAAMKRTLDELRKISEEYDAPILCAGDIFDHWDSSPELINFALQNMPPMISIPGQHDLPFHSIENVRKSAWQTLVEAGLIVDVSTEAYVDSKFQVVGFPFGKPLQPMRWKSGLFTISLIHKYVWTKKHSYPNPPPSGNASVVKRKMKGYNIIISGDNHTPFCVRGRNPTLFNCGTLMRRKSDEKDYKPRVGLIFEDGTVQSRRLDISNDIFVPTAKQAELKENIELEDFLNGLSDLERSSIDFAESVHRAMQRAGLSKQAKRILIEALEGARNG
jgi:hypothetical protein